MVRSNQAQKPRGPPLPENKLVFSLETVSTEPHYGVWRRAVFVSTSRPSLEKIARLLPGQFRLMTSRALCESEHPLIERDVMSLPGPISVIRVSTRKSRPFGCSASQTLLT